MAIKHVFTIICENIIVSQHGKISFIDMFTNVKIPSILMGLPKFGVAVGITGDIGDRYTVVLEGPKDDSHRILTISEGAIEENARKDKAPAGFTVVISELQNLIFTAHGVHNIVVRDTTRKRIISRHPFNIIVGVSDAEAGPRKSTRVNWKGPKSKHRKDKDTENKDI